VVAFEKDSFIFLTLAPAIELERPKNGVSNPKTPTIFGGVLSLYSGLTSPFDIFLFLYI